MKGFLLVWITNVVGLILWCLHKKKNLCYLTDKSRCKRELEPIIENRI